MRLYFVSAHHGLRLSRQVDLFVGYSVPELQRLHHGAALLPVRAVHLLLVLLRVGVLLEGPHGVDHDGWNTSCYSYTEIVTALAVCRRCVLARALARRAAPGAAAACLPSRPACWSSSSRAYSWQMHLHHCRSPSRAVENNAYSGRAPAGPGPVVRLALVAQHDALPLLDSLGAARRVVSGAFLFIQLLLVSYSR